MAFRVVADSSSNLYTFDGLDFAGVPLKVLCGRREYADTPDLDVDAMVDALAAAKEGATTSCPNAHEWLQAYGDAEEIFAVAITSNLSGTCSAAMQAADDYLAAHPNGKIRVFDTLSTGPEMVLIVEKLRQCEAEGKSFAETEAAIDAYMQHTHLLFMLKSLANLAKNGRVSSAVAKVAGVLGVRVVGCASQEGTLELLHKSRGEKKAVNDVLSEMRRSGFRGGKVRITHCRNLAGAKTLMAEILVAFPGSDVSISRCNGLCSYYADQGGLLIGYEDQR